jgi:general secretion pathway protein K
MRRRARSRDEAGSIAIVALWSLAIIAILLAAALRTTHTELRVTQNAVAASRARLAAEGGTQLGLSRLLRRHGNGAMVFDGTPEHWQDGSVAVDIAIIDEAGKIDLNLAPLDLLQGLFAAVGRPRDEALQIACNVLDRRGDVGVGCPEPADDIGFGRPERRPPRLFLVPEELAQVPGVDDRLYDAVADNVTVATRASAVDPVVAARPVLLAIPGATPALVDAYLEQRARWHDLAASDTGADLFHNVADVMTSPARDFTISAVATDGARARYRADLQVRLTDIPGHPYEFVAARAPPADRGRAAPSALSRRVP